MHAGMPKAWTAVDLATLDQWYPTEGSPGVHERLPHRSRRAIFRKAFNRQIKRVDIEKKPIVPGDRFGILTVVRDAGRFKGSRYWICVCDCATDKELRAGQNHLKTGHTTSCGCLTPEKRSRNMYRQIALGTIKYLPVTREGYLNSVYSNLVKDAKKRNIPLTLTRDEMEALIESDCTYCDIAPQETNVRTYGCFKRNGIDRVVSANGYDTGNAVPACTDCNLAKHTKTEIAFARWVIRINDGSWMQRMRQIIAVMDAIAA